MVIRYLEKEVNQQSGSTALACLKALDACPKGTLAAISGNKVLELNDPVTGDCDLAPLTLENEEGRRIYERSLRFVMLLALKHLFPAARVRVEYSVGSGVFVRLPELHLRSQNLKQIEAEMKRLTASDLPFVRKQWPLKDAIRYFEEDGQQDKVELLRHRPFSSITLYCLEDMWEYFYGPMTVSTGAVSAFTLHGLQDGFVLQLPTEEDPEHPAPYVYRPKYLSIFAQSAKWCNLLGITNVSDVTRMAEEHRLRNFIRVNEALHEKAIDDIAARIIQEKKHIVLVAGPSSSGKTTFSGRLAVHLQTYGVPARRISMDDFFINRDDVPLQPDGSRDFEDLAIVDLPLLSSAVNALLAGDSVDMPVYNFIKGCREYRHRPIRLQPGEILIIEGIHGLNPKLAEFFPVYEIHRVFISALTCLNLDDHNRIRTTDVRLLRRIVRDNRTRGTSPESTLAAWPSVRRGEKKWIFAYQENADSMFNSTLHYELPVLKIFAGKLLKDLPADSPYAIAAGRLRKTLNYLPDIDPDVLQEIPNLSLLREFIGGCTLEEE